MSMTLPEALKQLTIGEAMPKGAPASTAATTASNPSTTSSRPSLYLTVIGDASWSDSSWDRVRSPANSGVSRSSKSMIVCRNVPTPRGTMLRRARRLQQSSGRFCNRELWRRNDLITGKKKDTDSHPSSRGILRRRADPQCSQ